MPLPVPCAKCKEIELSVFSANMGFVTANAEEQIKTENNVNSFFIVKILYTNKFKQGIIKNSVFTECDKNVIIKQTRCKICIESYYKIAGFPVISGIQESIYEKP